MTHRSPGLLQKAAQWLSAFLLGMTAILILGEILMRVLFALIISPAHEGETAALAASLKEIQSNPSVIHVVTLGESTTDKYHVVKDHDNSWPTLLERELNRHLQNLERPYSVKVTNLARGGTSSPFQAAMLRQTFSDGGPDVIISMLGIDDSNRVTVARNPLHRSSYLLRFFHWANVAYRCPSCHFESPQQRGLHAHELTEEQEQARLVAGASVDNLELTLGQAPKKSDRDQRLKEILSDFQQAHALLRETHKSEDAFIDAEVAGALFRLSQRTKLASLYPELRSSLLEFASLLANSAYEQTVLVHPIYLQNFCLIEFHLNNHDCLNTSKIAFQNGVPITYPLLNALGSQKNAHEDPFFQAIFAKSGFQVHDGLLDAVSIQTNYQAIGDFALERDSLWFAMQYPTGSIEGLRQYLKDSKKHPPLSFAEGFYRNLSRDDLLPRYADVLFVSNANFNQVVSPENTDEYFVDLFASNRGLRFGHATEKGNALIAKNAMSQILQNWDLIENRKRRNTH
ncbi:MAG: SGNH/GDSL hydrolase family protein [Bdellovibrionales bacterium]|jgi:hypothetical protein|nr:SGNH/GDSL hydrolase family protein [Bdellovibrionales bacterium]